MQNEYTVKEAIRREMSDDVDPSDRGWIDVKKWIIRDPDGLDLIELREEGDARRVAGLLTEAANNAYNHGYNQGERDTENLSGVEW